MATVWLTYCWDDNRNRDVDYLAQELEGAGVAIKLDRWTLSAGRRLWEQIENFIQNPAECDAWAMLATQASLGSEPVREEFSYALDRALGSRGGAFPIIALFNGPVNATLLPAALRTRLAVSTTDREWKERIKAAAEGRAPTVGRVALDPYELRIHENATGKPFVVEMRPRAGSWSPFCAAVPIAEKDALSPTILHGPANLPPQGGALFNTGSGQSDDGQWWVMFAQNEATPTQSYYLLLNAMPTRLAFGVKNGQPIYTVDLHRR